MLVYPNYEKCILNYISSIRKHYGKEFYYSCNEEFDEILKENNYRNIIILLLDGLGLNILNKQLDDTVCVVLTCFTVSFISCSL